jgi:NADPH-dependent curcumin reductase CurA
LYVSALRTFFASRDYLHFQGLKDIGKLKAEETLLVSGAAGSVGSLVCQIGKKTGAKVYAIAGSQSKCDWLEKELGVDMALNYKSPTFKSDFQKIGFLDVYFDNVGGETLDMALGRLKQGARIVLCGKCSHMFIRIPRHSPAIFM